MEKKDFFDFDSKLVSSTVQAHAVGLGKNEKEIDNEWNLIKGNYENINFPIMFKQK